MVAGMDLSLEPSQSLLMEGASWLLKLATLMAQAHVELAHLVASIQKKKKISIPLILQKSHDLI